MAADGFLTPADVAARSGLSTKTVYRAIRARRLRASRPTARYLIAEADYVSWVRSGAQTDEGSVEVLSGDPPVGSAEELRAIEHEAA